VGLPTGSNDHLLEGFAGPVALVLNNNTAFGVWFRIASLGSTTNTLFVVQLQAFDNNGDLIGTYQLTESGAYGSGGVCTTLSASVPGPTPCNDAPYVGLYDPAGRIRAIYISVFNPNNLYAPIGFAMDSLLLDPI
jgi:hypothetical protein